jgi:potassium efflux system protein
MQHMAIERRERRRLVAAGLMVLLGLVAAAPGVAQDSGQPSVPTPAPTPQPTPIPAPDIPAQAAADADMARNAVVSAAPDARLQDIQQRFPAEQDRISQLREETSKQLKMLGPASMIKESEKSWVRVRDRLDRWLTDLSTRSGALNDTLDDLQNRISLWQLTRDHESADALPKAVRQQIADTITSISDAEKKVRSARDSALGLQTSVAQEKSRVDEMLVAQQQEITKRTKGVMGIDSPPLWKAFGVDGDRDDALEQFKETQHEHWRSLKTYVAEQGGRLLIWALMWPGLTMLMVVMRRKAETWAQQDPSLNTAVTLLSRPVSAALVLTALLNTLLEPQAPGVWTDVLGLVVVLAMVSLLLNLLPKTLRLVPSLVVLLYLLWRVVELSPDGFLIHRLALLALAAGGIAVSRWLIQTLKTNPDLPPKKWRRPTLYGVRVAIALFAMGAIADVVGSVDFAALLLTGTAATMLFAFLWWLVAPTLRSMVRVALLTKTARRIGIAPAHSDTVRVTVFRMISFWSVVGWLLMSLKGFLLLDPLIVGIRRGLDWSVSIGTFSIDPGDILIFALFFWLSFKIADFVQFVFTVDVMPRVDLPKGIPETISRLTRYVIIAVGAVIASAAAGFDISKVSIILGGLGVGVGFGLQNIVNNFVSGLILLFERPIRVGDTLDIDDTGGTVEQIGMRASIVSTWDGAEVVVPNANLISEDVTNWTLTHDRRRMVISIGVSYSADPERAAQIIVGVANDHRDVDSHPEPACLLVGFGDSSLDLQLRAWTAGSKHMGVASDLRFAIARKLGEAGIEIPFPQRDFHMRTLDPDAAGSIGVLRQAEAQVQDRAGDEEQSTKQAAERPQD